MRKRITKEEAWEVLRDDICNKLIKRRIKEKERIENEIKRIESWKKWGFVNFKWQQ